MKKTLCVLVWFLTVTGLLAQTNRQDRMQPSASRPMSFGEWSGSDTNQISFGNIRARLVISETIDNSDSRTAVAYLELHNASSAQNTLYIYYRYFATEDSPVLKCELKDAKGNPVRQSVRAANGWFPPPCWLALPYDSTLRFLPMTLSKTMAANGELCIDAGYDFWRFPRGDTNDYYLSGKLMLSVPQDVARPVSEDKYQPPQIWQGTLQLPPVKIPAKRP